MRPLLIIISIAGFLFACLFTIATFDILRAMNEEKLRTIILHIKVTKSNLILSSILVALNWIMMMLAVRKLAHTET